MRESSISKYAPATEIELTKLTKPPSFEFRQFCQFAI